MISLQYARNFGILMMLLVNLIALADHSQAQTSAPGLLQPAYMPGAQAAGYPAPTAVSPPSNYYPNAGQMVNSRVPRQNDVMATDQHSLFQYRRMYRNGTTPQAHELAGQWKGVNKGIVQIAGYGQFIKDIQAGPNGEFHGDNVQVSQVKPGLVRLDGWQPKFDYQTSNYERLGKFQVQAANGRGFFGHGATLSYADGGNAKGDPAKLLQDQVVRIDHNHMIGRAVAKFGPIKIPIAYFVLERREEPLPVRSW